MRLIMASHLTTLHTIAHEIEQHPAWLGTISGLRAEKLLRSYTRPYLYILRSGEGPGNYYLTFIQADLTIKHQPFLITETNRGWHFENGGAGGPFLTESFDEVLHLIMHCTPQDPTPLTFWS